METVERTERKSFGVLGLVVGIVGLIGALVAAHFAWVIAMVIGGAIGVLDWRTTMGKAAVAVAIVGLLLVLVMP